MVTSTLFVNKETQTVLHSVGHELKRKRSTFVNKIFDIFGIKTARFQRSMRNRGLALRLYRLKDLPALHSLFNPEILLRADGLEHRAFSSLLSFYKWITTAFQMFYVIEIGENSERRIIGFVGLYNMKIGQTLWLSLAIFNPEDRRRGYGQQALQFLLNSLQSNGVVETVRVEVLKTNVTSLRFFKKLGFEAYRKYEDRFLLEKYTEKTE